MTNFTGFLPISGNFTASDGESATFSGNFGITLSATLDSSGNGTGTETVSGDVHVHYVYSGGSGDAILHISFSEPNILISSGHFSRNSQIGQTLFGSQFGVTITGTVSGDQHTVSDDVLMSVGGVYQGITFNGTIHAFGTLTAPYVPTITGTAANQTTLDITGISAFHNVVIGDLNSGMVTVSVTLSSSANGSLTNYNIGNYSNGTYTVTGTAAQVTAALDGLVFTPTPHQGPVGQTFTTSFTIHVTDTSGGDASNATTSVIVTETGPAITGAAAGQTTFDTDGVKLFKNIVITDNSGAASDTVTVTLSSAANGTLSNLAGGSYDANTGIYSVTGSAAAITAALEGLVFNPTVHQAASGQLVTTGFSIHVSDTALLTADANTTTVIAAQTGPSLITLADFKGTNGAYPVSTLVADSAGNLFGVIYSFGANMYGGIFEMAKTANGYAAPVIIYDATFSEQFNNGLIIDSAGNLLGTTRTGGANNKGSVFELAKTGGGYASTLTTLYSFNDGFFSGPGAGLVADSAGNLFGTTQYGPGDSGFVASKVFKIAKTAGGYASTATTIATFAPLASLDPQTPLMIDADGNLFGTTTNGAGGGTVFEIVKTAGGYDSFPAILATFSGSGNSPVGPLIADTAGNLYGVTQLGGTHSDGTIFKIAKTGGTYSSTPVILYNFGSPGGGSGDPRYLSYGLIMDAAGNLFGTTMFGGAHNNGTVFKLAKTPGGYASTATTLYNFEVPTGVQPHGALISDAAGNLYAPANGGGLYSLGTLFELRRTGFKGAKMPLSANDFNGDVDSDLLWQHDSGQGGIWLMNGSATVSAGAAGPNPGTAWHIKGAGDFDGDGKADILWQNDNGQAGVWMMNGTALADPQGINAYPGTSWHVKAASDFDGDGKADILWQHDTGQAGVWLMNGGAILSTGSAGPNPGAAWHVRTAGDFDGDSKADILWQNDNGQASIWLMDGTSLKSAQGVAGYPGPSWHVVGSGDFDGDGHSDILWQNDNGQISVWLMNGAAVVNAAAVGANPGTSWAVKGASDLNGDGLSDILLQNTNGQAQAWLMSGTNVIYQQMLGSNPGTSWHLVAGSG